MLATTPSKQQHLLCWKIAIPIAVVVLLIVEVFFGLLIVAKLPFGAVVGTSVTRWLRFDKVPTTDAPQQEESVCSNLVLKPFQSLPTVALVSYPQSGNAWVRHLLEKSTGIYSTTIYDSEKRNKNVLKAFPGSKTDYRSGRAVCAKTYRYEQKHIREFEAGILLIRHPYQTIISQAYKERILKPDLSPEERALFFQGHRWKVFVQRESLRWRNIYLRWIQGARSTYVVHYEDLISRPNKTLEKMVRYLNVVPVVQDRLVCALTRFPPLRAAEEKRREWIPRVYFAESPYTQELESTIMEYIVDVNISLMVNRHKTFPGNFAVDLY